MMRLVFMAWKFFRGGNYRYRAEVGVLSSAAAGDHLFHDLLSASLQWPHPASREKPHSFVSVATVNDINVVAGDSIMKSRTGVLRDKGEERLSPRIVRELKDLVA